MGPIRRRGYMLFGKPPPKKWNDQGCQAFPFHIFMPSFFYMRYSSNKVSDDKSTRGFNMSHDQGHTANTSNALYKWLFFWNECMSWHSTMLFCPIKPDNTALLLRLSSQRSWQLFPDKIFFYFKCFPLALFWP